MNWTVASSSTPNGVVSISFNESVVNWPLIEDWAGAAGSMWQGWAVTEFLLDQDAGYVCMHTFPFSSDGIGQDISNSWFISVLVTCIGPGTIYVDSRLINGVCSSPPLPSPIYLLFVSRINTTLVMPKPHYIIWFSLSLFFLYYYFCFYFSSYLYILFLAIF